MYMYNTELVARASRTISFSASWRGLGSLVSTNRIILVLVKGFAQGVVCLQNGGIFVHASDLLRVNPLGWRFLYLLVPQ